jgi:hypothetical protein
MSDNQPVWKYLTNLGDVNFKDHDGLLLFKDETGHYTEEVEKIARIGEEDRWEIYRVVLDRCTFENGVLSDNQFHKDMPAWWVDYDSDLYAVNETRTGLAHIASHSGLEEVELAKMFCSVNPEERALAYEAVASYYGWMNLDHYPLTLNEAEFDKRYDKILKEA